MQDHLAILVTEQAVFDTRAAGGAHVLVAPALEVLGELDAPLGHRPLRRRPPHDGQQVRAPCRTGAVPVPDGLERPDEGLGGEVLRGMRTAAATPGVVEHIAPVPFVKNPDGFLVCTIAYQCRQFVIRSADRSGASMGHE